MTQLPVSGLEVRLRQPAGVEDVLLQEAAVGNTHLALWLLGRLASPVHAEHVLLTPCHPVVRGLQVGVPGHDALAADEIDWGALTVTDLEALLLGLRQLMFGNLIRAEAICPAQGCQARMDVAFQISDYLAYHQPRAPHNVEAAEEPGWYRLKSTPVLFRLPSGADQAASRDERDLVERCVHPTTISARLRQRIETAMEALAPSLSREVEARCPECGAVAGLYFDVQSFVLHELREQAAHIYEEVHLLARQYHWAEAEIMALPRRRRRQYADWIRMERTVA